MSELASVRLTYPPETRLGLQFVDVPLVVYTNAPRLDARLRDYFGPYVTDRVVPDAQAVHLLAGEPVYDAARLRDVPRRSHGRAAKEALYDAEDSRVIVKRATGVTIYVTRTAHYVVGDLDAHFNQALNAVTTMFARAMLHRGYLMLHASAILGDSGGVAFASPSGVGKSTMALLLVERSQHLVTNDRLFVRPLPGDGVEMVGVPKKPRVNPGTLLRIPRLTPLVPHEERAGYAPLSPQDLWTVERKHDVDVDALYGPGTVRLRGHLRAVFILHWSPVDRGWDVRTLEHKDRAAALGQVLKDAGVYDPAPPPPAERARLLNSIASAVSVYEVQGRADLDRLAELVLGRPQATGRH